MGRKLNLNRRVDLIETLEQNGVITDTNRVVTRKQVVAFFPNLNDHVWLTGNRIYRGVDRGTYVVPTIADITPDESVSSVETTDASSAVVEVNIVETSVEQPEVENVEFSN